MIDAKDFQLYANTHIQHRWNRIYNPILLICWSLHLRYVLTKTIRSELITIIKKESSILFESLFSDKDIRKFYMQLIDWNNKAYPFDFEGNWDEYLSVISNIHSLRCNKLTNRRASKLTCIRWHMIQDENIKNHDAKKSQAIQQFNNNENENADNELFDLENEDEFYNLEQLENLEENIMKPIDNIEEFNANDEIIYNEATSEYSTQSLSQVNFQYKNTLENWFLLEKFDSILL
ncbi:10095_t:CDS:2 [Dentiscutata heterogama]|uniref:10095_t:CDS:1 n=1 Tax=Dentiscutata heterogama TaxID=1316150 RepID=A0ACA9LMU2_9GLOM|nr:10095_t:CDS:2 [Dentiscutata heterogama]